MKYINTKTRAIVDSPCNISGGAWVAYEDYDKDNAEVQESSEKFIEVQEDNAKESADISKNEMTKEDIINELEALGIEYDKKAKKEELYKLMMGE